MEVRFPWPEDESDHNTHDEIDDGAALKEVSRTVLNCNEVCYINGKLQPISLSHKL